MNTRLKRKYWEAKGVGLGLGGWNWGPARSMGKQTFCSAYCNKWGLRYCQWKVSKFGFESVNFGSVLGQTKTARSVSVVSSCVQYGH